jgi:agmatinase
MTPLEELSALLRPAGGGLYLVSTGRDAQEALQRRLYGVSTEAEVKARFERALEAIAAARVVILGAPSDVGAGFLRGANLGPQMIRTALLDAVPSFPSLSREAGIVDIGDVFVVPQLLHDEMLGEAQKAASRRALYPQLPEADAARLPVSPLSIAERALDLVFALNPRVVPVVLGGDHSNAWPVSAALSRARKEPWGIVQPDAHTDLLAERLGIKYCFATWSYHANELVGRGGRLVQVGIRASRRPREHWEGTLGVRQFWAEECRADEAAALDAIIAHVKSTGVRGVYFSNDIDGTDESFADATGTPEPSGLTPDFVVELIRRLGREVGLVAGDIMEVAPPIQRTEGGAERTVALAVRYLRETVDAALRDTVLAPA